jgi:hypothetical protein
MVTDIVGCIKKGTLAELPAHGAYLTDYLYYVTSGSGAGDLYWDNGSAWILLQGALKTEILENKNIDPSLNTLSGVILDPFITRKREGFLIPSASAAGSLKHAIKGVPAVGTYSLYFDSVEKYVSRFTESNVLQVGYQSNATSKFVTKRSLNPYLKVRCRTTDSSNTYFFLGFSSKTPNGNGAFPVTATDAGCVLCMTSTNSVYLVRTSNGTAFSQNNSVIPRDNIFRTYEIIMSAANIIVKIDGATIATVTTNLPPLETEIYLLMELHNRANTNSFDISKAYFRDDIS